MSKVTQEIIDQYNSVGVAHVPEVFGADLIDGFTDVIDDLITRLRAGTCEEADIDDPVLNPIEFEDHDGYTRLINCYRRSQRMQDLVLGSGAAEIVGEVIGSKTLRPWLDGTFMKEGTAAETATPWHNDECSFSFTGSHSPSMWIALTDVGQDNAPLQTLAGSNKDPHRYFSSFSKLKEEPPPEFHSWDELMARVTAPDADIRVWEAKAGDMLIIHPKTIHGSLPRTADTAGRRLAFSLRWLGDDIRYQLNPTMPKAPYQSSPLIKEGEPPPEEFFPVTWRAAA